jgi:formiminotetrahydrofolate cyclodeaminase
VYDPTTRIDEFLEACGARQATPGGGSVTALAGALAASMGEMAVNYSLGKKGAEARAGDLEAALGGFKRARVLLLGLMSEDQAAYEALTAARKLDADAPQRFEALMDCIRVPQSIAAAGVSTLDLCDKIVEIVNPRLLSDLAVCAELAMATTRCGIYNVRANLADLSQGAGRGQIESTNGQLLSRAVMLVQRIVPRIWERIGSS